MHPILLNLGNVTIYSFGLFLALGILGGAIVCTILMRQARMQARGFFDNLLFIIFAGVIGARIAYVLTYLKYFKPPQGSWLSIFALWQGGLVFYGGLIAGLIAAWYVMRGENKNMIRWFLILLLSSLFGIAFGQAGCVFGGCAEGVATSSHLAINGHVPTALIETAWAGLLFIGGLVLYFKKPIWSRDGRLLFTLVLSYLAGRLFIDYWRGNIVTFKGISAAVIADVILLLGSTLILVWFALKRKRLAVEEMY